MKIQKCLGCYENSNLEMGFYHSKCSRKLFGTPIPPSVDFGIEDLEDLAKKALSQHLGITGVQPKLSVDLSKQKGDPKHRLFIAGLWGNFIMKLPSPRFPDMPIVEDVTMHMARESGIKTADHGLIQLRSGELAYVTRRFDREKKGRVLTKIAVEDFCQLSGLLTERKYKTSMEKAGKVISEYSSSPGLDMITFLDIALFSFLTGNADMHLKNFSLMTTESGDVELAPAYDLISTRLMPIRDTEEMALPLNGKKSRLTLNDFRKMAETLKISQKVFENRVRHLEEAIPKMRKRIEKSFLSFELKKQYGDLLSKRSAVLFR